MRGIAIAALLLLGCPTTDPPAPSPHPTPPAFRALDIVASEIRLVDPAEDTEINVGGARLSIPAGAFVEPVEVILVQMVNPAAALRPSDGAVDGQIFLSDHTYAFFTDREVRLFAPLALELPVQMERLAGASIDDARVTAVTGGFAVVQGPPDEVVDGRLKILIDGQLVPAGPPFSGTLRAFGSVPFQPTVGRLAAVGTNVQGFVASFENTRLVVPFQTIETEHFRVRYRGTTTEQAQQVAEGLEVAFEFLEGQLGFTRPNVIDLDGRHTVFLEDFDNLSLGTSFQPDGMNIPGSLFIEGASYVNTDESIPPESFLSIAVHEYFHALQYGAITSGLPNAWTVARNPQGNWLFEGTAALMAGRIVSGNLGPAVERRIPDHHGVRWSIFSVPRGVDPPADVSQELFFFIERELGTTDHYRAIFEGLASDLPERDDRAPSVAVVDDVLQSRGSSLGELFGGWVRDYLFDDPESYGSEPPPGLESSLDGAGMRPFEARLVMPPLSYDHRIFTIPPLDPDILPSEQVGDAEVIVRVREGDPFDLIVFVETDAEVLTLQPTVADEDTLVAAADIRAAFSKQLRVAVANRGLDLNDTVSFDLEVRLVGEADVPVDGIPDATQGIVVYQRLIEGASPSVQGLDIDEDRTWEVAIDGDVELIGVSDDGGLLVARRSDLGVDELYRVADFGRGTPRNILTDCDALTGNVRWPRIGPTGDVHFIGPIDEGDALFRANATVCAPIPLDLTGDGSDDTGAATPLTALATSRDHLAFGGPEARVYLAPTPGGEADETEFVIDAGLVESVEQSTFSLSADGASFAAGAAEAPLFVVDGRPDELDNSLERTGGVTFVDERTVFPISRGFVFQRGGRDAELVEIAPEATPSGTIVPSHGGRLLCFTGANADEFALYCAREDGRGLLRLMPAELEKPITPHYWPDR
ncbi:MAG: hypothetical protein AAGE52_20550 [Myxococcota bacterium]